MTIFAGALIVVSGVLHAVQGPVALFYDTFFVVGPGVTVAVLMASAW